MNAIDELLREAAELVNLELDRKIPADGDGPAELRDAMRWSIFAGGKRMRPALVLAVGRSYGADDKDLVSTCAAIEMMHTYSLIHDDLPSMDNDDLRRGRETCHVKFGEATAILAGDALQAMAFQTIAEDKCLSESVRIELMVGLGQAAASMVVGQQMDLASEGKKISVADLEAIHSNKTGALIEFSATAGAVIARAPVAEKAAIAAYGKKIGLLFQIVDDLLDMTGTTVSLGKTAGKDLAADKATYPSVLGFELAKGLANEVRDDAVALIKDGVLVHRLLEQLPSYILERSS